MREKGQNNGTTWSISLIEVEYARELYVLWRIADGSKLAGITRWIPIGNSSEQAAQKNNRPVNWCSTGLRLNQSRELIIPET